MGPRLGPKTAQTELAKVPGCLPTTQCPETLEMPQDLTWTADDGDTFVCPERPSGSQDVVCFSGGRQGSPVGVSEKVAAPRILGV